MAINETEEEVVEEIPEVVEAEPLTQKEIEAIAGEIIEANPEKQSKGIMDFEATPPCFAFPRVLPYFLTDSSQIATIFR